MGSARARDHAHPSGAALVGGRHPRHQRGRPHPPAVVADARAERRRPRRHRPRGRRQYRLLAPRVRPFRDVFAAYELLPYLSVRGPRLGYVCKELPVERRYPEKGKTPTKIVGWGSYARLLAVVFRAIIGRYNP